MDTRDIAPEDSLPQYYMRQSVEQFFDCAKDYGKMMPVRNHNVDTISGHMLMSFIATFLCTLIKNRMNIMDTPDVTIPKNLVEDDQFDKGYVVVKLDDDKDEVIMQQEPSMYVFESNPHGLFFELNMVGADVFENQPNGKNEIIRPVRIGGRP